MAQSAPSSGSGRGKIKAHGDPAPDGRHRVEPPPRVYYYSYERSVGERGERRHGA
ncbi:MAG: hypothetical protein AVDCRST_MAG22-1636 [uncultured Rubrobacteraceae bacterium]|uniref:Uncharacterized protein n=1 Tax=uncultured Rubrobacteraceae bacterium TaxID=349277 RepID=A0A6J4P687_9ACTN|nr:MAG: hypothetical protein AVDCRST_MAG22-1636 [uncultured Rubrobacteraceae bacterium]